MRKCKKNRETGENRKQERWRENCARKTARGRCTRNRDNNKNNYNTYCNIQHRTIEWKRGAIILTTRETKKKGIRSVKQDNRNSL